MKEIVKEAVIHIMIGIVLFCTVFGAVTLATQEIKQDLAQIRVDVDEIADQLGIDLSD